MNARPASGGSSGGSGGSGVTTGNNGNYMPTSAESKTATTEYDKFAKYVDSKDYDKLSEGAKLKYVQNYQEQIIGNADRNIYGKNSLEIANMLLDMMYSHPKVSKLMSDYTNAYNKVQSNQQSTTKEPYKHIGGGQYTE